MKAINEQKLKRLKREKLAGSLPEYFVNTNPNWPDPNWPICLSQPYPDKSGVNILLSWQKDTGLFEWKLLDGSKEIIPEDEFLRRGGTIDREPDFLWDLPNGMTEIISKAEYLRRGGTINEPPKKANL